MVLRGRGDASFRKAHAFVTAGQPAALVAADLDGDGRPDLAAAASAADMVSVLLDVSR